MKKYLKFLSNYWPILLISGLAAVAFFSGIGKS
jgi:hypothetical protein